MGGWAVRVTRTDGSSQIVYARVADKAMAERAVARMVGDEAGAKYEAFEWVDASVFDDMNIGEGRVGQWH
jgi:hypothetical protein